MASASKIKYLSLVEASRVSGYSADHLGYLMRAKKMGGKKIGRDWFTTYESLKAYMNSKKFLPAKENISPARTTFLFSIKKHFGVKQAAILISGILILAGIGYLAIYPNFSSYQATQRGDADVKSQMESKNFSVDKTKSGDKNQEVIKATTYVSDTDGNIEISIKTNPVR